MQVPHVDIVERPALFLAAVTFFDTPPNEMVVGLEAAWRADVIQQPARQLVAIRASGPYGQGLSRRTHRVCG
jgi:hypothetical protein